MANEPKLKAVQIFGYPQPAALGKPKLKAINLFDSAVVTNISGTLNGYDQNLFAYWKLDETSATIANTSCLYGNAGFYVNSPTLSETAPTNLLFDSTAATFNGTDEYVNVTALKGPVGHWRLDETSGTSATDSSEYATSGVYVNTPTLGVTAPTALTFSSTAVTFNGSNEYMYAVKPQALMLDWTNKATYCFWINNGTNTNKYVFSSGSLDGSRFTLNSYVNGSNLYVNIIKTGVGTVTVTNAIDIGTGTWHHIAIVYGGSTSISVYLDGVLATTKTFTHSTYTALDANARLYIGVNLSYGSGAGAYFAGSVDDFRVYNRELSESEIGALGTRGLETTGKPGLGESLTGIITFSFWYKSTSTSLGDVFGSTNSGATTIRIIANSNNNLNNQSGHIAIQVKDEGGRVRTTATIPGFGAANISDGSWHHIGIVHYPSSSALIFVDGQQKIVSTTTTGGSTMTNPANFTYPVLMGCYNNAGTPQSFMSCTIDDFRIYFKEYDNGNIYDLTGGYPPFGAIIN